MKSKSSQRFKLKSYDDLFNGGEKVNVEQQITSVPLDHLHPFQDHPFRVMDDEKMEETVESVKKYGVLIPSIVRPHQDGYELIAGHRRKRACELAGLKEMPVIIRELDDDAATVIMVDTNIQREDILPSEKAFAYKMKYDALKHQGSKGEKYTADLVGEAARESGRTVQRYIRLTELSDILLGYVDGGQLLIVVGERLSYLSEEEQGWITDAIAACGIYPSKKQADQMKEKSEKGTLTKEQIYALLVKPERKTVSVTIPAKKLQSYFPSSYTREQIEEVIETLLEQWKQNGERDGTGDGENTV